MFRNFSHTDLSVLETYSNTVAPHAGAWIETSCIIQALWTFWSHPMRVRGLKH